MGSGDAGTGALSPFTDVQSMRVVGPFPCRNLWSGIPLLAAAAKGPVLISLVAALDESGLIGAGNRLPWRLRGDMRRFRRLTMGKPLLMGAKDSRVHRASAGRAHQHRAEPSSGLRSARMQDSGVFRGCTCARARRKRAGVDGDWRSRGLRPGAAGGRAASISPGCGDASRGTSTFLATTNRSGSRRSAKRGEDAEGPAYCFVTYRRRSAGPAR